MFETSIWLKSRCGWGSKPLSFLISLGVQLAAAGALLLLPLIGTHTLPLVRMTAQIAPLAPPPTAAAPAPAPRMFHRSAPVAPLPQTPHWIPQHVAMPAAAALPPAPQATGVIVGSRNGASTGLAPWYSLPRAAAPPAPEPPALSAPVYRIGGDVEAARCLDCPPPRYPFLARQARIQGTVVLRARIGRHGRIRQLALVSGPGLLAQAAIAAVRAWRYAPTRLNGMPVEVETLIRVRFSLAH